MDFKRIIRRITKGDEVEVSKGDNPGHDFHGNQWVTAGGGFNPNAGGRGGGRKAPAAPVTPRKPAAVRQPKPAPTPKPAPEPVKPPSGYNPKADGVLGNFKGLKTNQIVSEPEKFDVGRGMQQKFMGKVEMADGSTGLIKAIKDWRGTPGETLVKHEILASTIGEAINAPNRSALPVDGQPDAIVQTWLPTAESAERLNSPTFPFDGSLFERLPEAVQTQVGEGMFFNALVGNGDAHYGNWMIDNYDASRPWGAKMFTEDTKVTPIDYSCAFRMAFPPRASELRDVAQKYDIPDERISSIMGNLDKLLQSGTLDSANPYAGHVGAPALTDTDRVDIISRQLASAFPHLVKP